MILVYDTTFTFMYQAFKYPCPVLLGNIALLSSKLNIHFFVIYRIIFSMETSSSPEQTSIIAMATTSTVVTRSKLKPPQEKILKVDPPVKPKSTKTSSTRSKLRHSTGHESRKAYQSLFTSSAPSRPKEQSAHWVTYFPYH